MTDLEQLKAEAEAAESDYEMALAAFEHKFVVGAFHELALTARNEYEAALNLQGELNGE